MPPVILMMCAGALVWSLRRTARISRGTDRTGRGRGRACSLRRRCRWPSRCSGRRLYPAIILVTATFVAWPASSRFRCSGFIAVFVPISIAVAWKTRGDERQLRDADDAGAALHAAVLPSRRRCHLPRLPEMHRQAVDVSHWMTSRQFTRPGRDRAGCAGTERPDRYADRFSCRRHCRCVGRDVLHVRAGLRCGVFHSRRCSTASRRSAGARPFRPDCVPDLGGI